MSVRYIWCFMLVKGIDEDLQDMMFGCWLLTLGVYYTILFPCSILLFFLSSPILSSILLSFLPILLLQLPLSSDLLFPSFPLPHSFYTCRCLTRHTYILEMIVFGIRFMFLVLAFKFELMFDPACFIGVDG